jgi:acetate kinase
MSILVLSPNRSQLAYSIFSDAARESLAAGRYAPAPDSLKPLDALWRQATGTDPRVVAIRVPFGGSVFRRPAVVTPQVAATLRELVPESPLHLPLVLSLIERCQRIWTTTLLVLVFETAFFADLPQRERLYGLDSQLTRRLRLRRYGYHGIYHGAACQLVARRRLEAGLSEPAKILSVCLEPRPEVAAAIGTRPQMVTGGATPLEGIPGQTSCGELDSSIVLTLARKLKWGPEQIDRLLTRQSGILGLLGRPATLDWVFHARTPKLLQVRNIIRYHILLACGAGIAAMGGLDAVAFSGRYVDLADALWPSLRCGLRRPKNADRVMKAYVRESRDRILADAALTAAFSLAHANACPA